MGNKELELWSALKEKDILKVKELIENGADITTHYDQSVKDYLMRKSVNKSLMIIIVLNLSLLLSIAANISHVLVCLPLQHSNQILLSGGPLPMAICLHLMKAGKLFILN